MINCKQKYRWGIMKAIVAVLFLLLFVYLGVSYYEDDLKYKKIEKYYQTDTESFDLIVKCFKELYKENLCGVKFDCNNTNLKMSLKDTDAKGEVYKKTVDIECKGTGFTKELSKLREKYQKNCDYPVFTTIYAYYDEEGNMLLHMQAYNEKINTERKRCYFLVYIEEGYSGNSSNIKIDSCGKVTKEPFMDNWYTWSMDWPLG